MKNCSNQTDWMLQCTMWRLYRHLIASDQPTDQSNDWPVYMAMLMIRMHQTTKWIRIKNDLWNEFFTRKLEINYIYTYLTIREVSWLLLLLMMHLREPVFFQPTHICKTCKFIVLFNWNAISIHNSALFKWKKAMRSHTHTHASTIIPCVHFCVLYNSIQFDWLLNIYIYIYMLFRFLLLF